VCSGWASIFAAVAQKISRKRHCLSPALLVRDDTVEQMAISYIHFLTSSSFALNVGVIWATKVLDSYQEWQRWELSLKA